MMETTNQSSVSADKIKSVLDRRYDECSHTSTTSTDHYDQEAFETFKDKVLQLCTQEFGHQNFTIEHIKGGSYNRIIGITFAPLARNNWTRKWCYWPLSFLVGKHEEKEPAKYIVRITRSKHPDYGLAYDLAALQFSKAMFGSNIPQVICHDSTKSNFLSSTYMIQQRLPGQNLQRVFKTLTIAQKECVVRLVVNIMSQLQNVTAKAAGVISPENDTFDSHSQPEILLDKFRANHHNPTLDDWTQAGRWPATAETTLQFLLERCNLWKNYARRRNGWVFPVWSKLKRIANSLHELGFIPDTDRFHFCHLDLHARNILIDIFDESTVNITGVLDWDAEFAQFCPKFMAYGAPFWLWIRDDESEWDEKLANVGPTDPELRRLKELFNEFVSDEWKRYAFMPEYILARRLFLILRDGIFSNDQKDEADDIVRVWQELHYDEGLDTDADSDEEEDVDEETVNKGSDDASIIAKMYSNGRSCSPLVRG